jgi:hypothetical protein
MSSVVRNAGGRKLEWRGGTTKSPGQGLGDAGALLQLLSTLSWGSLSSWRQRYAPPTASKVRCSENGEGVAVRTRLRPG